MSPEKKIKVQAKAILAKNNWPAAVGVIVTVGTALMSLLYLADTVVMGLEAIFDALGTDIFDKLPVIPLLILFTLFLAGVCLLLPLFTGALRFMYLMSKTSRADYSEMFHYFTGKRYLSCLKTHLGIMLRKLWQLALSFIPAIVVYLYASALSANEDNLAIYSILCYFISYVLLVVGVFIFNSLTMKYFLSVYFYIENDNLNTFETCSLSAQNIKKFGATTVKLNFSLLPAVSACLLVIPTLFVLPYVMTAKATSAKWIIELSKRTENKDE